MPNCDVNYDCFNCPYADCIDNTGYDPMDPVQWRNRQRKEAGAKKRAYFQAYYQEHRDEILTASRNRYWEKHDKVRAKQTEYYQQNREKQIAKAKSYYYKNREKVLARQKQRYYEQKSMISRTVSDHHGQPECP